MSDSLPPTAPSSGVPASQPSPKQPTVAPGSALLQTLDEVDLGMPRRRRLMPLVLFLATCFFTYAAGAYRWLPVPFGMHLDPQKGEFWSFDATWKLLQTNWQDGLTYMVCVMAILVAHEMGHFLMTVRYRVHSSYPIFIPMPIMLLGTMGAVISMEGFRANRKQMFDIGLAGPLAGLVLTIPMVWIGIKIAEPHAPNEVTIFGDPLLARWLIQWLRPDLPPEVAPHNAVFMAGWVGMFVTGLNMMPISQLDGGHVIYALFLKRAHVIARAFLLFAIAFVVLSGQYTWTLMVVLVTFIGVDHPPTSNDRVPLGPVRIILGLLSLALPILCFTPFRLSFN